MVKNQSQRRRFFWDFWYSTLNFFLVGLLWAHLRWRSLAGLNMVRRWRHLVGYTSSDDLITVRINPMPNRLVCTVLDEMRKCNETRNYSYLLGLIEEVQTLVNRMESALYDQSDLEYARKKLKELEKDIELLEKKKAFLTDLAKDGN